MTDEELIARLRSALTFKDLKLCPTAADRIEELVKERDALIAARDTMGNLWTKEKARAALPAVAASQTPDPAVKADSQQAVRVKPLVWVKHPNVDIWRCDTVIGTYKVFGVGATASWDFDDYSIGAHRSSVAADVEAAKSAAQADYEQRILAAIETQPISKSKECPQTSVLRDDLHDPRDAEVIAPYSCPTHRSAGRHGPCPWCAEVSLQMKIIAQLVEVLEAKTVMDADSSNSTYLDAKARRVLEVAKGLKNE